MLKSYNEHLTYIWYKNWLLYWKLFRSKMVDFLTIFLLCEHWSVPQNKSFPTKFWLVFWPLVLAYNVHVPVIVSLLKWLVPHWKCTCKHVTFLCTHYLYCSVYMKFIYFETTDQLQNCSHCGSFYIGVWTEKYLKDI